jgi:threonine dehydrogenase-like Zn-dependent dehydrogenase
MKTLNYHGGHDVRIDNVPDPIRQEDDDMLLRVTATAICGSDLHLYRGKIPGVERGDIPGQEFMGIVEDVGPGVVRLKSCRPAVRPGSMPASSPVQRWRSATRRAAAGSDHPPIACR